MKIKQITETTVAGSIATVAKPLGKVKERTEVQGLEPAEKVIKGKAKKKGPYANSLIEGKMKELSMDLKNPPEGLNDAAFKKKYGKTKEEMRKGISEGEILEQDLIAMPGMRRMKDTSFIPHKADRRDHEVEMARSDLYAAAQNAMRIFKLLKDRTEDDGLMGWQQSYITLASDYLNSVADSIEYNAKVKGGLDEMTGGVLAGGMSNFEEGSNLPPLPSKELPSKEHKPPVERNRVPGMAEEKCPSCGGELVSEELVNEKKDACYYKVKSRYKVWPSAYASGALVKCRKVGASNWGKSKK